MNDELQRLEAEWRDALEALQEAEDAHAELMAQPPALGRRGHDRAQLLARRRSGGRVQDAKTREWLARRNLSRYKAQHGLPVSKEERV